MRTFADDYRLGDVLERSGKKLKKGKNIDYPFINAHIQNRVLGMATGLTKGCDIDITNYRPFMRSGYAPFDDVLCGIPMDGPIVIYGKTGVGKSHMAANLISCFLHEHEKKIGGNIFWRWERSIGNGGN